ncbi:MAG: hypothetical protein DI630_29290 [Gordonia sp. (in: high G+C Gram-positive bacteria)]|nr:MAG: hypothetical protein DI630_29290 [Gordonia sp. (in: high G+C Gram-positive bacteria)]
MRLVSTVIVALVLTGVGWGVLTWAADGKQPFSEGWWPTFYANVESAVDFGGDTIENKLPNPENLPQPDLGGNIPSLDDADQEFVPIPGAPGQPNPLDPGAGAQPPAIPAP